MLRGRELPIPDEIAKAICEFEAAASERKVIAERLRSIVTRTPAPPPPPAGSVPWAVYLAVLQIDALVGGGPIPVTPELVGLAAIHARFATRKLGDCMLLSLIALAKGGEEFSEARRISLVGLGRRSGRSGARVTQSRACSDR